MKWRLRELSEQEAQVIHKMAHAQSEEARLVQRATIVEQASHGVSAHQIALRLHLSDTTVRRWIGRFNEQGLDGLLDRPRKGAPRQYPARVRAQVIATALQEPAALGLPFASWTLERLQRYLQEACGIPMGKTRLFEVLQEEGLRWYKQEGWFGERVDPQFAQKRGPSNSSAAAPQPTVPSWISMRWDR